MLELVRLGATLVPDRGRDRARFDHRRTDAPVPQLMTQRFGQRFDGVLRRRVGRDHRARRADRSRTRRSRCAPAPAAAVRGTPSWSRPRRTGSPRTAGASPRSAGIRPAHPARRPRCSPDHRAGRRPTGPPPCHEPRRSARGR